MIERSRRRWRRTRKHYRGVEKRERIRRNRRKGLEGKGERVAENKRRDREEQVKI